MSERYCFILSRQCKTWHNSSCRAMHSSKALPSYIHGFITMSRA